MNTKMIDRIFSDTAYVRTGGSVMELECARYLQAQCAQMELDAKLEPFPVTVYTERVATLSVDGKEIPCKGYYGSPSGRVQAPLYYLSGTDVTSLKKCKGRIVLTDKPVGYKLYDKLTEHGAIGFITYSGNPHLPDRDIDRKEITYDTNGLPCLYGVHIHVSDAIELVKKGRGTVEMTLQQTSDRGASHNLVLDLDGDTEETVVICAHYDTTSLSTGAYDNMSSCIALLKIAEYFSTRPHHRRIRLLWCGSEERGLLGSIAYCQQHGDDLKNTILNINLDMLGSLMGEFVAFSCVNEEMLHFLDTFFQKHRFSATSRYAIRSSDSNSFVHFGIPAVSFARYAPSVVAPIHTRYDTANTVSAKRLLDDANIIIQFTECICNASPLPISMEISEKIRGEVAEYMKRKKIFQKNKRLYKKGDRHETRTLA